MKTRSYRITIYLKLFRLGSVLIMCLFLFLPILFKTNELVFAFLQTLPFIVMLCGEIALNDCCDFEKDCINKPQRPLVNQTLDVKKIYKIAEIMVLISILLGIAIYRKSVIRMSCFLVVTVVLACYNLKNKIIPLIKTVITASMTVLTLSFVYTYVEMEVAQFFFLGTAFFFILGREILMDIRDVKGDMMNDYNTLAVVFGMGKVKKIALCSFFISSVCAVMMVISDFTWHRLVLIILTLLLEFYCVFRCTEVVDSIKQNEYILLMWLPMLLMLVVQLC